jgi:hypothetical protein
MVKSEDESRRRILNRLQAAQQAGWQTTRTLLPQSKRLRTNDTTGDWKTETGT